MRWREIVTIEEARCGTQARQDVMALLVETVKYCRRGMPGCVQQQGLLTPLMLACQKVRLAPLGPMCQGIRQNGADMFDIYVRAPTPPGERLGIAIHGTRQAVGGTIADLIAQVMRVVTAFITDFTGCLLYTSDAADEL